MELKLSYIEAQAIIAPKFNLDAIEVRISPPIGSPEVNIDHEQYTSVNALGVANALITIFDQGKAVERNEDKTVSKIALIKAIRTVTNANLKDAKDLAESMLSDF